MLSKEHEKVRWRHSREFVGTVQMVQQFHFPLSGTKGHETRGLIFMSHHQAQVPM